MNKYAKEQFDKIKELKKQIPASDNKEQFRSLLAPYSEAHLIIGNIPLIN